MSATVILTFVIFILLCIYYLSTVQRKRPNYPPGPFSWPIIGNRALLKSLTSKLGAEHLAYLELSKRYRSDVIALRLGANNVVIASGTKFVNRILNGEEYDGRPWNEFIKMRNLGKKNGITMNDGPEWKELRGWMMRTLTTFGFGKREMSEMIKDELIVVLENLSSGGQQRIKTVVSSAVINVLWILATGNRCCEGPRLEYFTNLLERRTRVFDMAGGLLSTFPWIRYIAPDISGYNLLVTLNNDLRNFLMETINEHKTKYIPGSEADLIDMFLREMHDNKSSPSIFTEDQLVMLLIDLFLAGCTTTSTALDFLFLIMVVHQDVQRKLQMEIDSVISRDRLPDLADRSKLPYTEAVLIETQRRWGLFPVIGPRRVLRDTNLENYSIPKDTTVLINIHSVNMDPNLYPDPLEFKPERFIENGVLKADDMNMFFGKGRRRCPGELLAKSALFLLFVGVMQKYALLPVPGKGPVSVEILTGFAIAPKPYEVLVVPR